MKAFYLATVLNGILVFGGSLLAPVEVRFIESVTNSTAVSGLVFGVASCTLAVLSYYVAKLSNRVGRQRTLLIGMVLGLIYSVLYASVTNTLGLFGVKFAWAFALAATNPILAAYVQTLLKDRVDTGRYFGYYYALASITGSAGALLGGYLYQSFTFSTVAYTLALTYLLAGLLVSALPPQGSGNQSTTKQGEQHKHTVFDLLRRIFKKPALRFYLASNISGSLNWGVKAFLWPLSIVALSGSDLVTGSIFATMGVVAFVLLPFAGAWADRVGPYKILLLEFSIFSVTGLTMAFTLSVTIFWIAAAFYTIAEVLNVAQSIILTKELDDDLRSEAMALDTSFDQILGFLSPLLAGLLITWGSVSLALLCFMGLYVVSLVVMVWLGVRHQLFIKTN